MLTKYMINVKKVRTGADGEVVFTANETLSLRAYKQLGKVRTDGFASASDGLSTEQEALELIESMPTTCAKSIGGRDYIDSYKYSVEPREYGFANFIGYSDVEPYEIVRVISDKTIEIRAMDAERAFDPEFVIGGFSAHCTNNDRQDWDITSNPNHDVIRARRQKNGSWKSHLGQHNLSDSPRKKYDFNF